MTTPLKSVQSLARGLVADPELVFVPAKAQDMRVILSATNLLLSQATLLLDKSSLENNTL